MAIRVSGVSATWEGSAVSQVFQATLALQRGAPAARTERWTLDLGTVTLSAYTRTALPDGEYGRRKRLVISAQNDTGTATTSTFTLFDADCVYLGAEIVGDANSVWRFDHLFRVMDTRGLTTAYPS
jgi:hypothetical protein